jgi:hypothetical protein
MQMFVICIQNKQNAKIDEIEMKFVDALYYTLITTKAYESIISRSHLLQAPSWKK